MAGEHIVIIDDDPDVREALTLMLEPAGYRLTCCSTGPEGTAAIRAEPPDLILLDIMLASPTEGFHLAYELKKDEAIGKIPIIMISAIGQTMGMDYAKELGSDYVPAERFLDKPLRLEIVLEAVQEALAKR
ncbi:MAG: response regulator [Phycisphaerales bacterium]|nr:MAG: response regulator [Phycisphaerales bacterium]